MRATPTALGLLTLVVLLDARDLWFKWHWLGPDEHFAVTSTQRLPLLPGPLALKTPSTEVNDHANNATASASAASSFASGWRAFLSSCGSIEALRSGGFPFFAARLNDCEVGGNDLAGRRVLPGLLVTSGARADAVAWAACGRLHRHRRPPLCHEGLVVDFRRRHGLPTPPGDARDHKPVGAMTDAEAELLNLLDVLSKSATLSTVVCVEGIASTTTATANASASASTIDAPMSELRPPELIGCANPTTHESAFVGHHLRTFAAVDHRDLAWLGMHSISILGMRLGIRHNAQSRFGLTATPSSTPDAGVVLVHESRINVSTFGALAHVLRALDTGLLLVTAASALQLARLILRGGATATDALGPGAPTSPRAAVVLHHDQAGDGAPAWDLLGLLPSSLTRSPRVLVPLVLARLLTWALVLPVTFLWAHADAASAWSARLHGFLTLARLWVLVLIGVQLLWRGAVALALGEARAYGLLQRTFVSPFNLIGATAVVLGAFLAQGPWLLEDLNAVTAQCLRDTTTFAPRVARSNAFPDLRDHGPRATTPLRRLYAPLVSLLWATGLLVAGIAVLRLILTDRALRRHRLEHPSSRQSPAAEATMGTVSYARLPSEDLLDTPIRALQLVRGDRALEIITPAGGRWLRPSQYLEHGVFLDHGRFLGARIGFAPIMAPKIHATDQDHAVIGQEHVDDDATAHGDGGGGGGDSPAKRRRLSAHVPRLR